MFFFFFNLAQVKFMQRGEDFIPRLKMFNFIWLATSLVLIIEV